MKLIHHLMIAILPTMVLTEMPSAISATTTTTTKTTATVIREMTKMKMVTRMQLMVLPSRPTLTSRRGRVSITSLDTVRYTYLRTLTVRKVHLEDISAEIEQPEFPNLIRQFIYNQQHSDDVSDASIS